MCFHRQMLTGGNSLCSDPRPSAVSRLLWPSRTPRPEHPPAPLHPIHFLFRGSLSVWRCFLVCLSLPQCRFGLGRHLACPGFGSPPSRADTVLASAGRGTGRPLSLQERERLPPPKARRACCSGPQRLSFCLPCPLLGWLLTPAWSLRGVIVATLAVKEWTAPCICDLVLITSCCD